MRQIYRHQAAEERRLQENARLTFERCQQLLPKKSKRQHRTLTQYFRLYRHENGQSYEIRLTGGWCKRERVNGAWVTLADKKVYDPPVAVIHPHNVAVLDNKAGLERGQGITVHNLYFKFFGVSSFSKSDRRSTAKFWWYTYRPGGIRETRAQAKPFSAGLQIDILTGTAVAGVPEEKRRLVNLERAKPLREQIADWDRFAATYFRMLDAWDERHVELMKHAESAKAGFPALGAEPTVEGLMQVLAGNARWDLWRLTTANGSYRQKGAAYALWYWHTAFERWKEHLYEQHGAFDWVPVDKAA